MLLIYVPRLTNRIGYTLNVIFNHLLRAEYEITTNSEFFENQDRAKICYGPKPLGDGLYIRSCELLMQTTIEPQEPKPFRIGEQAAIFPTYNAKSALPFDVLAAVFWCLSRYEEYLPHRTDIHGRYIAAESTAFHGDFLCEPVVDQWALMLADAIRQRYPDTVFAPRHFDFEDTFDIDAAYCYKHKGLFRSVVGAVKDQHQRQGHGTFSQRVRVLRNKEQDPFDTFERILETHKRYPAISLKFFPLMADYNVNDKSISYHCNEFRELLKHLDDYAQMGIHASYASYDDERLLPKEIERLETILHRPIIRNRYHFLRFNLPKSYQNLMYNNIQHDFSMGYAEEPGFRAGTCAPYPFFDLESDFETQLMVHPFAVMDSTLFFYKKMTPQEAEAVYMTLLERVKAVEGTFSALWHNPTLCETLGWQGWSSVYDHVLEHANEMKKS
ncbi:MAG: polysaccharide deacetylase family protein [Bacteroidales bacterium]|nr:polysaccharide deacetylase family protein [Bacteroidales bacterium]